VPHDTRELLLVIRKMIHGSNIIEEAYKKGTSKDNKVRIKIFRRVKHVLSQFYSAMMELEVVGLPAPEALGRVPSAQDLGITNLTEVMMTRQNDWEAVWHSDRRKFVDLEIENVTENHRDIIMKERKMRSRELDLKRKDLLKLHARGTRFIKKEKELNCKKSVCRICQKANIPTKKLVEHNKNCKKVQDIKKELLKINQWLITECANTGPLKEAVENIFKLGGSSNLKKPSATDSPLPGQKSILKQDVNKRFEKLNLFPSDKKVNVIIPEDKKEDLKKQPAEDCKDGKMKTKRSNSDLFEDKNGHRSSENLENQSADVKDKPKPSVLSVASKDSAEKESVDRNSQSSNNTNQNGVASAPNQQNLSVAATKAESDSDEDSRSRQEIQVTKPSRFSLLNKASTQQQNGTKALDSNMIVPSKPEPIQTTADDMAIKPKPSEAPAKEQISAKQSESADLSADQDDDDDDKPPVGDFFDSDSSSQKSEKSSMSGNPQKTKKSSYYLLAQKKEPEKKTDKKAKKDVDQKEKADRERREKETKEKILQELEDKQKKEEAERASKLKETPQRAANPPKESDYLVVTGGGGEDDNNSDCFGDLLSLGDDDKSQQSFEVIEKVKKDVQPPKLSSFGIVVKEFKQSEPVQPPHHEGSVLSPPKQIQRLGSKDEEKIVEGMIGDLKEAPDFLGDLIEDSDTEEDKNSKTDSEKSQPPNSDKQSSKLDDPPEPVAQKVMSTFSPDNLLFEVPQPKKVTEVIIPIPVTASRDSKQLNTEEPIETLKMMPSSGLILESEPISAASNLVLPLSAPAQPVPAHSQSNQPTGTSSNGNKELMIKFKSLSKSKAFSSQVTWSSSKEKEPTTDAIHDEFVNLKFARDCLARIVKYGEEVKKSPFPGNTQDDVIFQTFLAEVIENKDFYFEDIKKPMRAILQRVSERIKLLFEIRVASNDA